MTEGGPPTNPEIVGDDDELRVGAQAAGQKTDAPTLVNQTTSTTMQQTNYMVWDPYWCCYVMQSQLHTTTVTQTHTRLDPGEYTGETDSEGNRKGKGQCKWVDGSEYDGDWDKGYRDGQGTFKSRNGDVYEGTWKNDVRHGPGKLTYASGHVAEGTWEIDKLNGEGFITNKGKKK